MSIFISGKPVACFARAGCAALALKKQKTFQSRAGKEGEVVEIHMPAQVREIIKRLQQNGYQAYAVGGCIRDSLRGKTPQDWDIATNALPAQVVRCFSAYRLVQNGIAHGTIGVVLGRAVYEITTYRVDGAYSDNRHPDKVAYTGALEKDLARRDFTINAMAYGEKEGIIDCFGGRADLEKRRIRCVGDAQKRFEEDALRMLRALRFASVLSFSIEAKTAQAIHLKKALLTRVSAQRCAKEIRMLLLGENAGAVLRQFGDVLAVCIPELTPMFHFDQNTPYHNRSLWEHAAAAVQAVAAQEDLRLAMLFHDIGKPAVQTTDAQGVSHYHGHPAVSAKMAREILTRMHFSKKCIERVAILILYHDYRCAPAQRAVRRLLQKTGADVARRLIQVRRADAAAQSDFRRTEKIRLIDAYEATLQTVLENGDCFSLQDLAVCGDDLLALGIPQGKQVGLLLNQLLNGVIEGSLPNQKDILLQKAKQLFYKE